MKTLTSFIVVAFLAAMLAGCLVRTRGNGNGHSARRSGGGNKSCGPAYHWNGYKCVHNGNGRGNGRGRGR